jgi:hypothetical protein
MGYGYRHYRHPSSFEFLCFDRAFVQRDAHVFMRFSFYFWFLKWGGIGHFHALCQFSIFSLKNCLKSSMFRVTRIRPFTTDIAAICPSTNDGVKERGRNNFPK